MKSGTSALEFLGPIVSPEPIQPPAIARDDGINPANHYYRYR